MQLNDKFKTFTEKDLADILKVSKTHIQHLRAKGLIKPIDWAQSLNKFNTKRMFIRYTEEEVFRILGKK